MNSDELGKVARNEPPLNISAAIGGLCALFMQWLKLRRTCTQLLLQKRALYTVILQHLERRKCRRVGRLLPCPPQPHSPQLTSATPTAAAEVTPETSRVTEAIETVENSANQAATSGGDILNKATNCILESGQDAPAASSDSAIFDQMLDQLRINNEEETTEEVTDAEQRGIKRKKGVQGSRGIRKGYCTPRVRGRILEYIHSDAPDFRYQFRISRPTFDYLNGILQREPSHGWGQEIDLLVYLFWLKSGGSCTYTSSVFNMSKSTVINMVYRVQSVILNQMASIIYLPQGEEIEEVAEDFAETMESPALDKVGGCIGRCHIKIRAPKVGERQYLNRYGQYSIQVQAVCDQRGAFRDIFVGYPGSASAIETLRASPLYQGALYPPEGYVLVGDESYPCLKSPVRLITPFTNATEASTSHDVFNDNLLLAHNCIKKAFGLMKKRWQNVFTKTLEVSTSSVPNIIAACAVLHNICLERGDVWDVDEQGPNVVDYGEVYDSKRNPLKERETDGRDLRENLANFV